MSEKKQKRESSEEGVLARIQSDCTAIVRNEDGKIQLTEMPADQFGHAIGWLSATDTLNLLKAARARMFLQERNVAGLQHWLKEQTVQTFDVDEAALIHEDLRLDVGLPILAPEKKTGGGEQTFYDLRRYLQAVAKITRRVNFVDLDRAWLPSQGTMTIIMYSMPKLEHLELNGWSYGGGSAFNFLLGRLFSPEFAQTELQERKRSIAPLKTLVIHIDHGDARLPETFPANLCTQFAATMQVLRIEVPRGGADFLEHMVRDDSPQWPSLRSFTLRCIWDAEDEDILRIANKARNLQTLILRNKSPTTSTAIPVESAFLNVNILRQLRSRCTDLINLDLHRLHHVQLTNFHLSRAELKTDLWTLRIQNAPAAYTDPGVVQEQQQFVKSFLFMGDMRKFETLDLSLRFTTAQSFTKFLEDIKDHSVVCTKHLKFDWQECNVEGKDRMTVAVAMAPLDLFPDLESFDIFYRSTPPSIYRSQHHVRCTDKFSKIELLHSPDIASARAILRELRDRKKQPHSFRLASLADLKYKDWGPLIGDIITNFPLAQHIYIPDKVDEFSEMHFNALTQYGWDGLRDAHSVPIDRYLNLATKGSATRLASLVLVGVLVSCSRGFFQDLAKSCPNLVNLYIATDSPIYEEDVLAFRGLENLGLWSWPNVESHISFWSSNRERVETVRKEFWSDTHKLADDHKLHFIRNETLAQVCQQNPKLKKLQLEINPSWDVRSHGNYPIEGQYLEHIAFVTNAAYITTQELKSIIKRCPQIREIRVYLLTGEVPTNQDFPPTQYERGIRTIRQEEILQFQQQLGEVVIYFKDDKGSYKLSSSYYSSNLNSVLAIHNNDGKMSPSLASAAGKANTRSIDAVEQILEKSLHSIRQTTTAQDITNMTDRMLQAGEEMILQELQEAPQREAQDAILDNTVMLIVDSMLRNDSSAVLIDNSYVSL